MKTEFNIEENKEKFKGLFAEQISNEENTNSIRVIDFIGANISKRYQVIEMDAEMHYFTPEGVYIPKSTHKVKQEVNGKLRDWKVDNSYNVAQRNLKTGKSLMGEEGEPLTAPAFDYFLPIIANSKVSLVETLKAHIAIDDANGKFNKQ